jgi:TonB family protein
VKIRATWPAVLHGWQRALVALSLLLMGYVARARAHEPVAPKIVHEVDGVWPEGIRPSTDVVVPMLVTVSAEGMVDSALIDVSLGPALDAAALRAVYQFRFEPAIVGGERVPSRARVAVRFRGPTAGLDGGVDAAETFALAPPDTGEGDAGDAGLPAHPAPSERRAAPDAGGESSANVAAIARLDAPARTASELVRDRKLLAAAPHRTGSDLLQLVPGMFVTQHSGEGKAHQIFYRGFDAVHGEDVEIWVGGAPVNEVSNIHGQGYADLHFVMPEVVRALRVSPGTYDPRQGDFAIAGTMRFELGYDQPGITAKGGYGQFGTQRYFLAYRPKGADEGTFAAAEFYDTDGFGPSRAARRASAIAQATFKLGANTSARLLLTGYTGHFDSAGVLRLSDIQTHAVSRFATYDPSQGGASMRAQLVAELRHQTPGSAFGVTPYLVLRNLRLRQNFTGFLLDQSGDSIQQLNDALSVGMNAFYRMRLRLLSANDSFEVGVSARNDWIDQSQKRLASSDQRVTSDDVDAKLRALDVAGYLDTAFHPHERVTLRAGIRIDGLGYYAQDLGGAAEGQARSSQGVHFGEKANVEVRLVDSLFALLSFGEGFRSPQIRSLAESESTPFTRVRSLEGGLRLDHGRVRASAAGFGTWLSEDLAFDPTTGRSEKVPATRRSGASVDASYQPLSWLYGTLNLTYTRAELRASGHGYRAGSLLPYAPQLVARADVAATPVLGEWLGRKLIGQLGLGASLLSRRPLPYGQFGHDIFLLDAQAGLRWGEVAINVRAFNLLDARWYDGEFLFASNWNPASEGASLVPTRHVTVGAPRTVFASLELYL